MGKFLQFKRGNYITICELTNNCRNDRQAVLSSNRHPPRALVITITATISRWDLDLRQIPNGFRSNFLSGCVELIDSPSIRRRGMSKNFPNKCFVNRTSWPNLCILFFSSLPQLQRPFEYDSCHASSSIFAKYVYLHLTSGHYMAYDKITKVV